MKNVDYFGMWIGMAGIIITAMILTGSMLFILLIVVPVLLQLMAPRGNDESGNENNLHTGGVGF